LRVVEAKVQKEQAVVIKYRDALKKLNEAKAKQPGRKDIIAKAEQVEQQLAEKQVRMEFRFDLFCCVLYVTLVYVCIIAKAGQVEQQLVYKQVSSRFCAHMVCIYPKHVPDTSLSSRLHCLFHRRYLPLRRN
jgi:hypothetical protein